MIDSDALASLFLPAACYHCVVLINGLGGENALCHANIIGHSLLIYDIPHDARPAYRYRRRDDYDNTAEPLDAMRH